MSVDPLAEKYPYNSTYAFQENKLGLGRELEGLETWYTNTGGTKPDENMLARSQVGPINNSVIEDNGYVEYGVLKEVPNYNFSNDEIESFKNWNENNSGIEPGECLGMATTGSEKLTREDAGFRNSNGENVLAGKTVYDLGENLEKKGVATEIPTSQGQETNSIVNRSNTSNTQNTAYLAGPAGGYHSIIITRQTATNQFSIYDQGTGWDIKSATQRQAQSQINDINSHHPTWGTRLWQLNKIEIKEVRYPAINN